MGWQFVADQFGNLVKVLVNNAGEIVASTAAGVAFIEGAKAAGRSFGGKYNLTELPRNITLPPYNTTGPPGNYTGYPPKSGGKGAAGSETRLQVRFKFGGSKTVTEEKRRTNNSNMSSGSRLQRARSVKAGRKKFRLMKLVSSNLNWTEQQLGSQILASGTFDHKHFVSEFDPGTGGYMPIGKWSNITGQPGALPMHVYDLNLYCGNVLDNRTNYPVNATNQNEDINSRAWVFDSDNVFKVLYSSGTSQAPRWYINDPQTTTQDGQPGTKVYRKGICIDFMLYGCRKTYTEYDVRVIKILDPRFCPDYDQSLVDDGVAPNNTSLKDFKQGWQSLVWPYCVNPMLKGIEPGPSIPKRWFKTVAKKRIAIGEQSADMEQVQAVRSRIYVNCNEMNNMAWDQKAFNLESGTTFYDRPPTVEAQDIIENPASHTKPHWRARYYLVIRALCPQDLGVNTSGENRDGGTYGTTIPAPSASGNSAVDYTPTYDLAVRTTYATLNGQV